jgi:RNA polymerase sigma factor (TIGR02999 family)
LFRAEDYASGHVSAWLGSDTLSVGMGESAIVLLAHVGEGDAAARNQLFELLYADLHKRAHAELVGHARHTLCTTALVHETYLKLFDKPLSVASRAHFFHLAARVMRQVLLDHVRDRRAQKRGGEATPITLTAGVEQPDTDPLPLIELDRALNDLHAFDKKLAQLTELHVFAGLEFSEIATLLDASERSVYRDWRLARIFLRKAMNGEAR